jgi:outer membrane protein
VNNDPVFILDFPRSRSRAASARRTLRVVWVVGVLALLPLPARAQDFKIGVLDFKQVTERSTSIRRMIADAEAPLAEKKRLIETKGEAFAQARRRLEARRSVLTDDQLKEEEQQLSALREEISDLQHEIDKAYERLDKEIMQPAVDRIMGIVEQVARAEGFDLVIPSEMALYHSEKADLTPLVIQTLDRQAAAENGAKPAAPADEEPKTTE